MVMIARLKGLGKPSPAKPAKARKSKVVVTTTTETVTTRTVSTTTATVFVPTLYIPTLPPEDHRLGNCIVSATECRCCQSSLPANEFHAYGAVCENCWVGEQDVKGKARKYKGQSAAERYRAECDSLFT